MGINFSKELKELININESKKVLSSDEIFSSSDIIPDINITKVNDRYLMVLGENYKLGGNEGKNGIYLFSSDDGLDWNIESKIFFELEKENSKIYSPKLSLIDNKLYLNYLKSYSNSFNNKLVVLKDITQFKMNEKHNIGNNKLSFFPKKVANKYYAVGESLNFSDNDNGKGNLDIKLFSSNNLKEWSEEKNIIKIEDVDYSNYEISDVTAPIKTNYGWLIIFKAIDLELLYHKGEWKKNYFMGAALLDLDLSNKRIIKTASLPLIEYRPNNITSDLSMEEPLLPGGTVLENNGELKIYYSVNGGVYLSTVNIDKVNKNLFEVKNNEI